MNAFANWFEWPMKRDGKLFTTDEQLRALLAEIWIFDKPVKFYRAWDEGIRCGRIYEVK
jgi:hypothetical protein